jgi:hypothetical protein
MPQSGIADAEAAQGRAPEVTQLHMALTDESAERAVKTPHCPTIQFAAVFKIAADFEHWQAKSGLTQPRADPAFWKHPAPQVGKLDWKPAQGDTIQVVAAGKTEPSAVLLKGVGDGLGIEEVVPILALEAEH